MLRPNVERIGKLLLLAQAAGIVVALIAMLLGDRVISGFLATLIGTAFLPCLGIWLIGYGSRRGMWLLWGLGWVLVIAGILFVVRKVGELSGLWSFP